MPYKDKAKEIEYQKRYREINRDKVKERQKRWREQNQEYMKQYMNRWREQNQERILEYQRNYLKNNPKDKAKKQEYDRHRYQNNQEQVRIRTRQYYKADPKRANEQKRNWRKANLEYVCEYSREQGRKWRKANPERYHEMRRRWKRLNPDKVLGYHHKRRARLVNALHSLTSKEWQQIKTLYNHRCVYCGKKPRKLTMDHVIPISKGGSHTKDNVVPACLSCNLHKSTGKAPAFQRALLFTLEGN